MCRPRERIDNTGEYNQNEVAGCMLFLAERLASGHEIRPNQMVQTNGVTYMIIAVDDDLRYALLDDYVFFRGLYKGK